MIKQTKDYDIFVFRPDNREKIDQGHVRRLIQSIQARNLLEMRPINVNEHMEILDGQHRLLAAKSLGVDIYYKIEKQLDINSMLHLNINKSWTTLDYLNFFCLHGNENYLNVKRFMKKHNLSLKVALNIIIGNSKTLYALFKQGKLILKEEDVEMELDVCWDSINYIKKMNGYSVYTESSRFWRALLKLVRHPDFDEYKWKNNMQKMISHFSPKISTNEFLKMMQTVYNWRNPSKIDLFEEEF